MTPEEIIRKLEQIEQQAGLTVSEFPYGLTVERQRLIQALARQLRAHVRDQLDGGDQETLGAEPPSSGSHLESVRRERASNV